MEKALDERGAWLSAGATAGAVSPLWGVVILRQRRRSKQPGDVSYFWRHHFTGALIGLTESEEDVDAAWLNAAGVIYLSTKEKFAGAGSVNTLSGDNNDLFTCTPLGLGANTDCDLAAFFDGDGVRFPYNIDDLAFVAGALLPISNEAGPADGVQHAIVPDEPGDTTVDPQLTDVDRDEEELLFNRNYLPLITR